MRRSHAMILLASLATLPPSDLADFRGADPNFVVRTGPPPIAPFWYSENPMSAAELVRPSAAKRRSKQTHRSKRGQRKRL